MADNVITDATASKPGEAKRFYQHADYVLHFDDWIEARDLYEGKRSVVCNMPYLQSHYLEDKPSEREKTSKDAEKLFKGRCNLTRYLNCTEIIVSIWTAILFRKDPELDADLQKLLKNGDNDESKDIDGKGNSVASFLKYKILPSLLNMGKAVVLVDPLKVSGDQARYNRPYLVQIPVLDLKDWQVETHNAIRLGRYNMLRYEYLQTQERTSLDQVPLRELHTDILYLNADGIYTVDRYKLPQTQNANQAALSPELNVSVLGAQPSQGWQFIETIQPEPHLKEIPVVIFEDESWLKDANQESLRFHNARSMSDWKFHGQGYQKIFVHTDDKTPEGLKRMGDHVVSFIGQKDSVTVVEQIQMAGDMAYVDQCFANCIKAGLNQLTMPSQDSKQHLSAEAQEATRESTQDLRLIILEDLERLINKAFTFYAQFRNVPNFNGKVQCNRDKKDVDLTTKITLYTAIQSVLQKLPETYQGILKRLIGEFSLDQNELDQLDIELKKMGESTQAEQERGSQARSTLMAGVAKITQDEQVPNTEEGPSEEMEMPQSGMTNGQK